MPHDLSLQRISAIFSQAIASLDIPDHKLALIDCLNHFGLNHDQDGDNLVVKENGEVGLLATFDEWNRLTSLEVILKGAELPPEVSEPNKSWDEGQLRRMLGG